ncbi:MAG TPA: DMT family transporter [Candidatus Limnocylindrales bacterium]
MLESAASRPRLAALTGAIFIAFSGILYRFSEVSPATATVFRCLYGLPILAIVAYAEHRRFGPLPARTVRLAAVAGIFFAGDLLFWHHAIGFVGVGLATVLGNLQVVVVAIAAWLLFGERPPRATVASLTVILIGVVLISGVVGVGAYGANPVLGVVLGVLTALCYAGYLLVIRRGGGRDLRRVAGPVAVSTASTAIVAAVVGTVRGELDPIPSWPAHGWLILLGIASQSVGYLFISMSLPRLPAALTSVILLAQPVVAVGLAMVLLAEAPSLPQLAGVALVVGGIAVATMPFERVRDSLFGASAG